MARLVLLLLAAWLAVAAAPPTAPQRTVYRHAALIDGTGAPLRRDMAVVVAGERIAWVGPDARLGRRLAGARVVDLAGRFLMPGLIDSHQHLATPPDRPQALAWLRRQLYGGVTAIRDMADDVREVAELQALARRGGIAAPDIVYPALVAGPSFFADPRTAAAARGYAPGTAPWVQAIDEATDIPAAIARARGTGAAALKIYANLSGPLVARLAAEAHRQGLAVWAHGMVFPATPADVIAAGPDVVSHVNYLAYQAMAKRPQSYQARFPIDYALFAKGDNAAMTALFREMRRRGIILDATIRVYAEREKQAVRAGTAPRGATDLASRLTAQAWRAGVAISAGTDGETDAGDRWPAVMEEMELLGRAGLPRGEVIRAGTLIGARTMRLEREMGSIAPGKLANLVVLARNPLDDLANLRSVVLTVKRGRDYPRGEFEETKR
ncbi:MAG: amidohydrolase family protein [Alphaproteobacteria bacterium]|nr:amidohydrolase family protein [Alphaproteobacteria bacterium]